MPRAIIRLRPTSTRLIRGPTHPCFLLNPPDSRHSAAFSVDTVASSLNAPCFSSDTIGARCSLTCPGALTSASAVLSTFPLAPRLATKVQDRTAPCRHQGRQHLKVLFSKKIRLLNRVSSTLPGIQPRERSFYAGTHVLNRPGFGIRSPLDTPATLD